MKKGISIIIKIVLLGLIVFLTYKIVIGIKRPIDFDEQRDKRFGLTIERLKDIRTAQIAFREKNGTYTPSFDSLLLFVKTDSLRIIKAIGFVPDTLTEKEALKLGIVSRDTFYVSIKDSLFRNLKYPLDSIRYVPTGTKVQFNMDTASVMTGSGIEVKVFEASAKYDDILKGLDNQYIINLKSKYKALNKSSDKNSTKETIIPVLRVGNLKEANNNAGNWE